MITINYKNSTSKVRSLLHPVFICDTPLQKCLMLTLTKGLVECNRVGLGAYEVTIKPKNKVLVSFNLTDKDEVEADLIEQQGKTLKIALFLKGSLGGAIEWVE
jgi:hypothetical protein